MIVLIFIICILLFVIHVRNGDITKWKRLHDSQRDIKDLYFKAYNSAVKREWENWDKYIDTVNYYSFEKNLIKELKKFGRKTKNK